MLGPPKPTPHALTWIVAEHSNLNPLAEGGLWIIFCMVRAMLEESGLPVEHWAAAAAYASYIYRRMPKMYPRINKITTPYAMLHKHTAKPHLRGVRLFGCKVHALLGVGSFRQPGRSHRDALCPHQ